MYLSLLWIILSLTNHFIPEFPFSKWVGIGLVIGSLIKVGFNSDKYLTEVSLKEEIRISMDHSLLKTQDY